jgi:hypothetical protein
MSAQEYIKPAIEEVERGLKEKGEFLPKKTETHLSSGYRPELDFSPELCSEMTNYYQGFIGILRWIVELGRIDIIVPVSWLSRYLVGFLLILSNSIGLYWYLMIASPTYHQII